MEKLDYYINLAETMIEADTERDQAFEAYEDMWHADWELPSPLGREMWIRKVVSTEPHDSIRLGTNVLSTLDPVITYQPLANNTPTKELANQWEKNLLWQLKSASKRRPVSVIRDCVQSALLYDEVCAQVIDLDYQIKQKQHAGAKTNRLKAARRYGRFLVNVYNPRDVHVRNSNMMPEAVLLAQVKRAQDVVDEFGDVAQQALGGYISDSKDQNRDAFVVLFDYWDYEVRCVWAIPSDGRGTRPGNTGQDTQVGTNVSLSTRGKKRSGTSGAEPMVIIPPTEHKLDFMPWALRMGGSNLERDEEHRRHPLLYPIYQSGIWKHQNISRTLYFSEVISHASAPRLKEEGTNPQRTEIDYGDPSKKADVPPGNVLTPIPPPPIDTALSEIDDRMKNAISASTVGQLTGLPSGASFAALNLFTQTELSKLKPYQQLAEDSIADVLEIMLLWCAYTEMPLYAYGTGKDDKGQEYVIDPQEIPTDAIYIDVELKPDVPTDRLQRINAASIAVNTLNYPIEMALEDIGVNDPQTAINQRYYEILFKHQVDMLMQSQIMELQAGIAQQQAEQEMMMQQAQSMMGPQGVPGAEGQGYNPAMGGMPPAMVNPNATMEYQTGMARGGEQLAEIAGL